MAKGIVMHASNSPLRLLALILFLLLCSLPARSEDTSGSANEDSNQYRHYAGIKFLHNNATDFKKRFGDAAIYQPRGAENHGREMCYLTPANVEVTLIIADAVIAHSRTAQARDEFVDTLIAGVKIVDLRHAREEAVKNPPQVNRPVDCLPLGRELPPCIGDICLGMPMAELKKIHPRLGDYATLEVKSDAANNSPTAQTQTPNQQPDQQSMHSQLRIEVEADDDEKVDSIFALMDWQKPQAP